MSARLSFALILAAAALSGCASLSKKECLAGDWYAVGVRDGAAGAGEDRLLEHAAACLDHGVRADRERWEAGREAGLVRYCTVHGGFSAGERGDAYRGVCGPAEGEFLRGYSLGEELHRRRSRLDWLDGEIRGIYARLDDEGVPKDERRWLRARLVEHEVERALALRDVGQLEAEAMRL